MGFMSDLWDTTKKVASSVKDSFNKAADSEYQAKDNSFIEQIKESVSEFSTPLRAA